MPHSIIRSTTTSRSLSMVVDTSLDAKPLIAPTSTKAVPPGTRDKGKVRLVPDPLSKISTTFAGLAPSGLASDSLVAKNGPVAPSAR